MKACFYFIIILCFTVLGFCNTKEKSYPSVNTNKLDDTINIEKLETIYQDTILSKLKRIDFKQFYAMPLDSLLKNTIVKNYKSYILVDEPPGKLSSVLLVYSKEVSLNIYLENFRFSKQFSKNNKWHFSDVRKECVRKTEILYNGKVLDTESEF